MSETAFSQRKIWELKCLREHLDCVDEQFVKLKSLREDMWITFVSDWQSESGNISDLVNDIKEEFFSSNGIPNKYRVTLSDCANALLESMADCGETGTWSNQDAYVRYRFEDFYLDPP